MLPNIDPYDMLIELNHRLHTVEIKHNQLAEAYHITQIELNTALASLRHLQHYNLKLHKRIEALELNKQSV